MIQQAIAVMFGITAITPIKAAWLAITLANVVMMLLLWWQRVTRGTWQASLYLWICAWFTMLQGSSVWHEIMEAAWAIVSALWVWTLLPKHAYGRIFALSIGLVVTCVLMLAVPPPWPGYAPVMYETRLYSTAAFLGVALGSALMTRNPSTMLAVPWFGAVMLASSQRGIDRWTMGIYTNLTWTACLICWLAISRRRADDLAASSIPDGLSVHRPTSRLVP